MVDPLLIADGIATAVVLGVAVAIGVVAVVIDVPLASTAEG